ncbi:hypothetical protein [Halobacillus seohaensis]|uniref:hypothetical protein n=1 Tax=Halobacillus seohaensis TaxID=447421 RepID=UPI0036F23A64
MSSIVWIHKSYELLPLPTFCSNTFFNSVQGATISFAAKKLNLVGPKKDVPHHSIELISMGKTAAEMIQYQTNSESAVVGKTLREVSFPNTSKY